MVAVQGLDVNTRSALIVVRILLGWDTHLFVERPPRPGPLRKKAVVGLSGALTAMLGGGHPVGMPAPHLPARGRR